VFCFIFNIDKMKKIIVSVLLICGIINEGKSCSACGCSASNEYMGLLPQTNNNFIGLQYSYRNFNTNLPNDGGSDPFGLSTDKYTTIQVWGRYKISDRIQLFAFAPYIINTRSLNGVTTTSSGISDMTVMGNYRLLDKKSCVMQQTLLVGAGLKMPTGTYNSRAIQMDEGLPNMQPGTKSWDIVGDVNYTVSHRKIGVNADLCYVKTTPNPTSYKFGNRQSMSFLGFYRFVNKDVIILPQIGVRYDHAGQDYSNFTTGVKDEMSGGWQLLGELGAQAYYNKLGVQLIFSKPVEQHFTSGIVTMNYKIETGVFFMF